MAPLKDLQYTIRSYGQQYIDSSLASNIEQKAHYRTVYVQLLKAMTNKQIGPKRTPRHLMLRTMYMATELI